jgi:hypothetical protein
LVAAVTNSADGGFLLTIVSLASVVIFMKSSCLKGHLETCIFYFFSTECHD